MRFEDWYIVDAIFEDFQVSPVTPSEGFRDYGYALRYTRELLSREEQIKAIKYDLPRPRVVRVAIRKTMREITQLATRWSKERAR